MMKFVHALNAVVAYIGMEKFGNAQTVTTQRKTKKEKLPITGLVSSGEEPFCVYGLMPEYQYSLRISVPR